MIFPKTLDVNATSSVPMTSLMNSIGIPDGCDCGLCAGYEVLVMRSLARYWSAAYEAPAESGCVVSANAHIISAKHTRSEIMAGLDSIVLVLILGVCLWLGAQINPPKKDKEKSLEEKFGENFRDIVAKAVKTAWEETAKKEGD